MTRIDARDRDVQSAFENAHSIASGKTTGSLDQIETSLWTALLALGRAMIALYLARVAARPRALEYVHDGFSSGRLPPRSVRDSARSCSSAPLGDAWVGADRSAIIRSIVRSDSAAGSACRR